MDRESYNPNDPSFLLSRRLDADLSSDELEDLETALRSSPQLRREAEQLGAVHRVLARWGQRTPQMDANTLANLAQAQGTDQDADAALARVDSLLHRWARRAPIADDASFTGRVLAKIRGRRRTSAQRLILRLGVPLAAAASVAIAVVGTTWFQPARVCQVTIGPLPIAAADRSTQRVDVSFAPFAADPPAIPQPRSAMGYMSLGVETVASADEGSSL